MTKLFQNRAKIAPNTPGKVACEFAHSWSVTPSSFKRLDFQELQLGAAVTGREVGRRVEQTNCFGA